MIDDHKLFVEGVYALLEDEPGIELLGYSLSAEDFLMRSQTIHADVYLVDINMPEISGIELTRRIIEMKPGAKILAVTMHNDVQYIQEMINSGANGYILKAANIKELLEAIQTVARGEKFLSSDIQQVIFSKLGGTEPELQEKRKDILSKREKEILALIAKDFSNHEIAEKLFISELTVETHRKNIFSKTRARSVVGLVKYAIQNNIISYE